MRELFQTKGNERQRRLYWFPTRERQSLFCLPAQLARRGGRKSSELPSVTRIASASPTFGCAQQWRVDWLTVEAAVSAALGKLQAARLPLQRCFGAREATYTRRKDFKLSSSSIFLQRCLRRPGERFDAADA